MTVDEKLVEVVARAICVQRGVNPDCQNQGAARDGSVDGHWNFSTEHNFGRPYDNRWHYGWRNQAANARAAILAYEAAKGGAVVYDEDPRVEVIERDVPVIWRRAAGGALEYALDIDTREIIGARIFLPAAKGGAAPAGWVMVPREPTPEMVAAGAKGRQNSARFSFRDGWVYALAAAPAAPLAVDLEKVERDRQFLSWLADRLVSVYGESPNVDFVHKLRALAASDIRKARECPGG